MTKSAAPLQLEMALMVIKALHYGYAVVVFFYFLIATSASICTLQTLSLKVKDQHVRRDVILYLMITVVASYMIQAAVILVQIFVDKGWYPAQDEVIYLGFSALVWGIQVLVLLETKFPVWYPFYGCWAIGILIEPVLLALPLLFHPLTNTFDFLSTIVHGTRICTMIFLPCLFLRLRNRGEEYSNSDAERQSLLRKKLAPKRSSSDEVSQEVGHADSGYGAAATVSEGNLTASENESDNEAGENDNYYKRRRENEEKLLKRLKQDGSWWTYAKGFVIFFPYVWPVHSKTLQLRAVLVIGCLLTTNFLNVLIPRQIGLVTDALVNEGKGVWAAAAVYAALNFANSAACIGWLQFWLWQPLDQYAYDALNTGAHAHVMSLSSDFHDTKEASDVHQAVFQGRAVTELVDLLCFQVLPMFVDLSAAIVYLNFLFGPYMGFLIAVIVVCYLYVTTKMVSIVSIIRRKFTKHFRNEWLTGSSSLNNWQIASYFNNITFEKQRYSSSIKKRLQTDKSYLFAVYLVGALQGLIMTFGLLGGLFLAIYQVLYGTKSTGDTFVFITYWMQLRAPLSFFSNVYKDISDCMIHAEQLLELFQTKPTILDGKNAKPLKLGKGDIRFDHVIYSYDPRKETLKNVDFFIPGGSTVAIVGETGSGKSTILKLLDRFYDVSGGSIEIDGQDVREVTLKSLRDKIGVVPQDASIFNDTIMNNVRYARMNASDNDVIAACRAAAIHDKVISLPDGYNTQVGNCGAKLSGGEKQRLAIARAILKEPEIILLDEATSAIDSGTEQLIQDALAKLCKGRTTIIVAHRLSTIMKTDRIIVIKDGEVIENGSHDELIHSRGKYHDLWSKQIFVKPIDKEGSRSSSRSPQKNDANIFNDLNPNRNATELAKVLRTTKHAEIDSHKSSGNNSSSAVPKLKPEAPEFIPRHLRADPKEPDVIVSVESHQVVKNRSKKEKEEHTSLLGIAKKAVKKAGGRAELSDTSDLSTGSRLTEATASRREEDAQTSSSILESDRTKFRKPRSGNRRHQSKSEPANRAQESLDGTNDSDPAVVSSGESQPVVSATASQRRVSAPSDPAPSHTEMRSAASGLRTRKPRHWRIKNRMAENLASAPGSASTSGGTSSADDGAAPVPPVTSPVGGNQTTGVRFVPGS